MLTKETVNNLLNDVLLEQNQTRSEYHILLQENGQEECDRIGYTEMYNRRISYLTGQQHAYRKLLNQL